MGLRTLLFLAVAAALAGGIAGGLARGAVFVLGTSNAGWLGRAALEHAALMICGFLGTVIGLERAVAVKRRLAFLAPAASGTAGMALLLGYPGWGSWLLVLAAAALVSASVLVVRRQWASHTLLLLVGALAWCVGNLQFAVARPSIAIFPWWFAFLVLTIAAERLEMTRLMPRRVAARAILLASVGALLTGAAVSAVLPIGGGLMYGIGLSLLAIWLGIFDIARRTVFAHGVSRYMALCLLGGYAWLAVAGVAWCAEALGRPAHDAALHALGLGFVISMVMGHAPVILPAIARVKVRFSRLFYIPPAVLHLSLVLRLGFRWFDPRLFAAGAALNAVAIVFLAIALIHAGRRAPGAAIQG